MNTNQTTNPQSNQPAYSQAFPAYQATPMSPAPVSASASASAPAFANGSGRNLPEKKFRAGAVSATIWKNAAKNGQNNEQFEYRSVSFERSYRDPQGNWKTTNSLRVNDLPKAMLVLEKAYEFIALSNAAGSAA